MSLNTPRSFDHIVIAVRDLEAAAAFYTQLGFQVGGLNRHPWGTVNRLIQFDGTFLELISVGEAAEIPPHTPGHFSFGAFVRDYLARREGFAMLALASDDATADAADFAAVGIGPFTPFSFERSGQGPDGSARRVAFTLAFARDELAPDAGLFVCQHHVPENFWNTAAQVHDNRARGIAAITMVAENPTDHHIVLEAFTGVRAPHSTSLGLRFPLATKGGTVGRLEVLTPVAAAQFYGEASLPGDVSTGFVGLRVAVADINAVRMRLEQKGIACVSSGPRLIVAANAAFGCAVAFEV